MKGGLTAAAAALALAAPFAVPAAAQPSQEIRFPPGGAGVTLEGRVFRDARTYTLVARRGQRLSIRIASRADNVSVNVNGVRGGNIGTTDEGGRLVAYLPYSGRYSLYIAQTDIARRPASYSMRLSIR